MLSVVVPAFNAERYIGECIESVLSQSTSFLPIEIVIVVDGATDGTLEKALALKAGHEETVQVIFQENMGPSAARNNGVSFVKTEYVTFLDADDSWDPDYARTVLPLLASKPDLVEYDATITNESGLDEGILKISSAKQGCVEQIDKSEFLKIFRCYSWARVYRTSHVMEHPFPHGRRFEDTATTPWFYWSSKKTTSVGKPLIRYRQHQFSILSTPSARDIEEISECIKESISLYRESRDPYWEKVAYRTHNFACDRISKQSISKWIRSTNLTRSALNGASPKNLSEFAQSYCTAAYVSLLKIKRLAGVLRK